MIAFNLIGVVFTEGHIISTMLMPLFPVGNDKKQVKDFWQGINQSSNPQLLDSFLNSLCWMMMYYKFLHILCLFNVIIFSI